MGVRVEISILILIISSQVIGFPDQGIWRKSYEKVLSSYFGMHKSLYAGSSIYVSVNCEPYQPTNEKIYIEIGWLLRQTSCFEEYLSVEILNNDTLKMIYDCPTYDSSGVAKVKYKKNTLLHVECSSVIHLKYANLTFVTENEMGHLPLNPACPISFSIGVSEDVGKKSEAVTSEVSDVEKKSSGHGKIESGSTSKSDHVDAAHNIRKREKNVDVPPVSSQNSSKKTAPNVDSGTVKNLNSAGDIDLTPDLQNAFPVHYNAVSPYHGNLKKFDSKIAAVDVDGVYLFILKVSATGPSYINVSFDVSIEGEYGYLSAADYPLLLFYGYMCGVYVVYAFSWLVVSALQWRDLLRIQFWIGAVILLGLIEKAVFYAEYQSINYTGESVEGAVIFAEIFSCLKRTLARMLVIIVSLGFGIVKPRLGSMFHRVIGVGVIYFILGTTEGCLRVLKPKNDPSNQALMAGVPLAVTDSVICWWIFSSLVQTNRTLRLRRNLVKLSLYRHFTNTLIFAVLASVAYMIWSIHSHKLVPCITDWKELWIDEAYWHLLFSLILLVIMFLWRPTNNNQRYAYTPLLDSLEDDNEDDFDQSLTNDAFAGMKMRSSKNATPVREKEIDSKQDDDLKWVEENVPSTFTETAVPTFLDSDEEIMTAKFERNKME